MDFILKALSLLFYIQDTIWRVLRLHDTTPSTPPSVFPEQAAGDAGFDWLEAGGGCRLFYRQWLPPAESPVLSLICIHGVGAHGRHFSVIGNHLAPRGIAVYAPDLAGHGLSDGRRGDLTDIEFIVNGIGDIAHMVAETHPGLPLYILGESFGSLLVLDYASRRPPELSGIVVCGTELEPTAEARGGIKQTLREYLRFLPYVFFNSRARVIDIAGREELVSRNKDLAKQSRHDPLRNNLLSPRTIVKIYGMVSRGFEIAGRVTVPVLILQGGHDLVTNPAAAWKLADQLASSDKRVVIFPEAYHGLFFDPDTPKVLDVIEKWLFEHSGKQSLKGE